MSFAFTAGVLTAFSPCGVPFLPNLVLFYLADDGRRLNGSVGSSVFALGLLVFLIPVAILAAALSEVLAQYTAFLVLGGGIVVLTLALASLAGRPLISLPGIRVRPGATGYTGLFVIGFTYIAAAVGCAPVLLFGVAATAVAAGSAGNASLIMLVFIISAVIPTVLLSILASQYRDTFQARVTKLMGPLKKATAILMVGMGAYLIVFYFLYTLGIVDVA
ncbi:MAG: cytochrome c biogenesis protein CcdA [Thermoplasmata archaeon]